MRMGTGDRFKARQICRRRRALSTLLPRSTAARDVYHLVGSTFLVAPIAAGTHQRDAAKNLTRCRIIIVGNAIHADFSGAVGMPYPHLQHVAVRLRIERQIVRRLSRAHAHDLSLFIHFNEELRV